MSGVGRVVVVVVVGRFVVGVLGAVGVVGGLVPCPNAKLAMVRLSEHRKTRLVVIVITLPCAVIIAFVVAPPAAGSE
jgi:hypothetical protein